MSSRRPAEWYPGRDKSWRFLLDGTAGTKGPLGQRVPLGQRRSLRDVAGVSAGTDLGFYLVSRLAGRAVAENAVAAAEYDWHRDPQTPIFYSPQTQS